MQDVYHQPYQPPSGGVLFIRVPYYTGDLQRDPSFENYPHDLTLSPISPHLKRPKPAEAPLKEVFRESL